jgi:signal transduction histidine kinase
MDIYDYANLFFLDTEGYLWWSTNESLRDIDISNKTLNSTNLGLVFEHAMSLPGENKVSISDFEINALSPSPTAFFLTPVFISNTSQVQGSIAVQITNDHINNIVQDPTGLGQTGEVFLVGSDYLLRSDSRLHQNDTILNQKVESLNVLTCFEYCFTPHEDPWYDEVYIYRNHHGEWSVGAHAYIAEAEMALISEMSMGEALAPITATNTSLYLMIGIFIALILSISLVYSRSMVNPIKQLIHGSKTIGEGNLDHRIDIDTRDEIEELATSFNDMAQRLRHSRDQLAEYATQLEEKVAERTEELRILNEQLEQKVRERTQEIEALLHQKDEFIGHLGHDLKTPLSIVMNLIPIIEEKCQNPNAEKDISIVIRNIEYISKLVHQTLEIAKLSAPHIGLQMESIPLASFVHAHLGIFSTMFQQNHITTHTQIDTNIEVKADPLQLRRVVENLISNAIKAMPQGGTLSLFTEPHKQSDMITIAIEDTGIGLADNQKEHIFQEFYKIDESRHHLDSTGMGLSICKRIIEQHGGTIWVESKGLGRGAIFKFTLPIIKP